MSTVADWFTGRLPDAWFTTPPEVTVDREEIIVFGTLPDTEEGGLAAARGRIARFREDTRGQRMRIADEAELSFGRKVAWGARCGEAEEIFTSLSIPVMTRLRQPERMVLDTLVEAAVARSRSEALAWCVRLVGANEREWIDELAEALGAVRKARSNGPNAG